MLFLPFALLMLLMVHAMMEFTVSLLVQKPAPGRKAVSAAQLRQRLLSMKDSDPTRRLVVGQDCDLEMYWKQEMESQGRKLGFSRSASDSRIRFLLDEFRHEIRVNQVSRSYFIFLGLDGWLPRLQGFAAVNSGPAGPFFIEEISRAAALSGWQLRPVLWPFEATYRGYQLLEAITPTPLRRWPARRFWGLLYPLSFLLGMAYIVVAAGPFNHREILMLLGISAAWWGIWGFLVWLIRRQ